MNEMLSSEGESASHLPRILEFPRHREFQTDDVEYLFRSLDVDPVSIEPRLVEAMQYLGSHSETMNDEARARVMAGVMEEYGNRLDSPNRLSKEGWHHVNLASTLTDVGKVGPEQGMIDDANRLVTALYAQNGKFSPNAPLSEFIEQFFPFHRIAMLKVLRQVPGLSADMPMRSFWDAHAQWTLDHLKDSGVPHEVVLTAAAHHLLEGDGANPRLDGVPIIDKATGMIRGFGIERPIDQREIWVVLFDKYEANMTRSGATHEGAIGWLREFFEKNQTLAALPELKRQFLSCLDDLHAARPSDAFQEIEEEQMVAK
ncbi:hypothetical protein HY733_00250 [Candidatus Uhrbacteria bacterium]|nr:hypothetical protein [Candidatus Uhrbacteria bacterium]